MLPMSGNRLNLAGQVCTNAAVTISSHLSDSPYALLCRTEFAEMFETRFDPLLSRGQFLLRMARSFGATLIVIVVSLTLGSVGYRYFGDLTWIDALLNASMILTGMGPVDPMTTTGGKLFASFYALYSGIAFLSLMAIILAPLMHRLLHKFHLDEDEASEKNPSSSQK